MDADNLLPDVPDPHTVGRRRSSATRAAKSIASGTITSPTTNLSSTEPDTCRICRAEATPDEPLFYPCKCSGSIKYVHQDCLMEWLSHSQKKHCELCKTPFRFTKLYDPEMPRRLPYYVFVSHMAKYMFRNLVTWLRAALVASVWLGWLPYLMRSVWSFLFWISDEGLGPNPQAFQNSSALPGGDMVSVSVTSSNTCASTPLLVETTTDASLGGIVDQIHLSKLLKALSKPFINSRSSSSFLNMIFGTPDNSTQAPANTTGIAEISISPTTSPHPSLLSEVQFLKHFTRSPTINRIVIAVLEGQVITLLVIVCFILIILVRDYVVQQQPEINMRAAFAAAEDQAQPPPAPVEGAIDDAVRQVDLEDEFAEDQSVNAQDGSNISDEDALGQGNAAAEEYGPDLDLSNSGKRPIAGFRRRSTQQNTSSSLRSHDGIGAVGPSSRSAENITASGSVSQLQSSYEDDHMQPASNTTDFSDPQSSTLVDDPEIRPQNAAEYMRIHRAAGGDQQRILQLISDEGLEDRLQYWVERNRKAGVAKSNRMNSSDPISHHTALGHGDVIESQTTTSSSRFSLKKSDSNSSSWTWAENDEANAITGSTEDLGKGKAKMEDFGDQDVNSSQPGDTDVANSSGDTPHSNDLPVLASCVTRPRAISDGPQLHASINPLANNNWSFSDLPANEGRPGAKSFGTASSRQLSLTEGMSSLPPVGRGPDSEMTELTLPNPDATIDDFGLHHDQPVLRPDATSIRLDTGQNDEQVGDGTDLMTAGHVEDSHGAVAPDQEMHPTFPPVVQPVGVGGIIDRMADFMWRDVDAGEGAELDAGEAVDIFGDNQIPQFMEDDEDEGENNEDVVVMAPDVVEAAVAAGLDPEAVEEAEDFEGIMELIGMRGPVVGLFQNAIFCAFLVSISIFVGIFIPYNIGRVSVWIVANPTRIVRMLFSFSRFIQDVVALAAGYTCTFIFNLLEAFRLVLMINQGKERLYLLRTDARHVATTAFDRISTSFMSEISLVSASEVRNFSAISHEALLFVLGYVHYIASAVSQVFLYVCGGDYAAKWNAIGSFFSVAGSATGEFIMSTPRLVTQPGSWMVTFSLAEASSVANPALAYWDANDRTWAILFGYLTLTFLAALYLARGTPLSSGQTAQEWEASVIDALNQASGVMKVILIISIEMLIFPLYCGLLLDFALLPLFEGTSLRSRLLFSYNYPLTSIFVHWFVGTGYMFHFALFVSMCRKIMRKGVLYFIRDPDDPEFHPVRDVLERNVTTQLRKILFSAFVYGALVVICLGGVVWGLSLIVPSVLPIHYSSNEPVLEFPIDLLFYNFLMPLAVRFLKPGDGLHAMYTWWFRKCARCLRLTWFLFGERRIDEEGQLNLAEGSLHRQLAWWRRILLEVDSQNEVVPKTWNDAFEGGTAKPSSKKISDEDMTRYSEEKSWLVESGQLVTDGRFARSPASDQVKIPKGQVVFLDVSEEDIRQDVRTDRQDVTSLHSSDKYQYVYLPPWFRLRIFMFILSIWIFAAVTGVGITIVPLVFGRRIFKACIPAHIRTNDIYAFSIGIYILGSVGYCLLHLRPVFQTLRSWAASTKASLMDRRTVDRARQLVVQATRLFYAYVVLLVLFPLLITLLVELYLLMPLHTYLYPAGATIAKRLEGVHQVHNIRVIQAWTLGILYLKLGSRALTLYGGRPALAVRAVLRRGWLEPDVGVLTRAFVIPGLVVSLVMIFMPPLMAWTVIKNNYGGASAITHDMQVRLYRLAYPSTAFFWVGLLFLRRMLRVFESWQVRIRDEAYLMGERLHNFGGAAAAKHSAWRARSTRLERQ